MPYVAFEFPGGGVLDLRLDRITRLSTFSTQFNVGLVGNGHTHSVGGWARSQLGIDKIMDAIIVMVMHTDLSVIHTIGTAPMVLTHISVVG